MVTVTERAVQKIEEMLVEVAGPESKVLRVSLKGFG